MRAAAGARIGLRARAWTSGVKTCKGVHMRCGAVAPGRRALGQPAPADARCWAVLRGRRAHSKRASCAHLLLAVDGRRLPPGTYARVCP